MDSNLRKLIPRYKKALIIVLVNYILLVSIFFYFTSSETYSNRGPWVRGFTPLIPSDDLYIEVALILLVFAPISALIGGLVGGYLVAPPFLFIHKKILGKKLLYGIQDRPQPKTFRKIS